jgi:hypothetical protein
MPTTLTFVKRADLPIATRGTGSGKPSVTVQGNGTFLFSTKAAEMLGTHELALFVIEKQQITVQSVTDAILKDLKKQKMDIADLATCKYTRGKKSKGVGLAGSGVCKLVGYDYKTSGNQTFDLEGDADDGNVVFSLPKGHLTPKPKAARKPRAPKAEVGKVPTVLVQSAGAGASQNPTQTSHQTAEPELLEA